MLRFSKKARQALAAAQANAKQMQHPSVEISHLLLALLELQDSAAREILTNVRLKPEPVRAYLAARPVEPVIKLTPSPNVKRILEFAVDAAQRRHPYIGTEHILVALARHCHPITRELLDTADVDCDRIRQRVESMFEAGLLLEQAQGSQKSRGGDIVDEAVQELAARILLVLEPDDWKTLERIARQISLFQHNAGPINYYLMRGRSREVLIRVLEEILRRVAITPDIDQHP